MMKLLVAALLASGLMLSTAQAAPFAPAKGIGQPIPSLTTEVAQKKVVQKMVVKRDGHKTVTKKKVVHRDRHRYRAGHRYAHAPRGWHRHHARPSYWQTRGCIMVGPLWFCP
jgi:Ni/Co efflux regulator RcnB